MMGAVWALPLLGAVPRMVHAWAAFSLLHGSQHSKSIFTHDAERAARPSAQRPPFSSLHPRHCLGPSLGRNEPCAVWIKNTTSRCSL